MFKKIVRFYAKKRLFNSYRSRLRNSRIKTLNNSRHIGILWNPVDEGSVDAYELLRKTLQNKGIKSEGIAHIETNREMETLTTISHSGFLLKQSISWFGRPKTSSGKQFIQEPFDILIDLSISKTIALQYILVHSEAVFKVGWQGSEPNYCDLNIDVSEKPECRFLMEQIIYYLENIHEKS
jgi:hypothetical protein